MSTPLRFAEVITDPEASAISVAAALMSAGPVATWPESPLLDAWRPFLDPLAALDARTTYVGTFRVAVQRAAAAMSALEGRDRDAAVVMLLQRTAVHAATPAEFALALRTIHRTAPDSLPLDDLLRSVVWVCSVTYRSDGQDAMVLGVPAAIDVLAAPGGPWLDPDAPPDLHEAANRLPAHVREGLVPMIGRLHAADAKVVRAALGLDAPRRLKLLRH